MTEIEKMTRKQLIREIRKLRKEINDIEDARALRVELPDSWVIKKE